VAFREGSTGAGLQILLEAIGVELRRELHRHHNMPWAIVSGMHILPGVMPFESARHVAGDPDVVTRGYALASEDINESPLSWHT
jgi:hypothetical protein